MPRQSAAARTSCIRHPENSPFVIVRQHFVDICNGDHCGAAILAVFEFWTNCRRGSGEDDEIVRTREEVEWAMTGLFSRTKISESLELLASQAGLGFITKRHGTLGKTNSYTLNVDRIHAALYSRPKTTDSLPNSRPKTTDVETENDRPPRPKTTDTKEIEPYIEPREEQGDGARPAAAAQNLAGKNPVKGVIALCEQLKLPLRMDAKLKDALKRADEKARQDGEGLWVTWRDTLAAAISRAAAEGAEVKGAIWGVLGPFLRTPHAPFGGRPGLSVSIESPLRAIVAESAKRAGCVMGDLDQVPAWKWQVLGAAYLSDKTGFLKRMDEKIKAAGGQGFSVGTAVQGLCDDEQALGRGRRTRESKSVLLDETTDD